jgi:hypothetical protein
MLVYPPLRPAGLHEVAFRLTHAFVGTGFCRSHYLRRCVSPLFRLQVTEKEVVKADRTREMIDYGI